MDQVQIEHEINDTHLLIDSGTESITESPVNEDESEQSEDSTVCVASDVCKSKEKLFHTSQNLLDKSFSIDEDELIPPLVPTQIVAQPSNNKINNNNDDSSSDVGYNDNDEVEDYDDLLKKSTDSCDTLESESTSTLCSILRRTSCADIGNGSQMSMLSDRRVSFPTDESVLVSYREPDNTFEWTINKDLTNEKILSVYQNSCKKHNTIELDIIKNQIQEIKNNTNHSAILDLSCIKITSEVNETLEDLFKVTNFHTILLNECKFTPETITEFLNMLEYYESVCHLEVSMNFDDEDTWRCFCTAISNIVVLESLSFKRMNINDQLMRILLHALKSNKNITTLKFDGCLLAKLPNFYLIENLMQNTYIRELYLSSTGLYTKEADVLGRFLQKNDYLEVLDISNNIIGDRGLEVLAKGLCSQRKIHGIGLSVLVVFNNQLTEKSGPIIKMIIEECKNLHTLNIGYNNLTDEVLIQISNALPNTTSLEGLGLQCTLLTCKGIDHLAQAIPNNKSLQKINLKGNKAIQTTGVEKLCQALTNSKIIKIEIDETNRSCNNPDEYMQGVIKMNAICTINKSYIDTTDEEITNISQLISRKISLSCDPKFTLPDLSTPFQIGTSTTKISPMPSPVSSPAPKSRFQISRVTEISSTTGASVVTSSPTIRTKSRFCVTPVLYSPEEEVNLGRFANVRSSVSSNDSVDSLTTLPIDNDSD